MPFLKQELLENYIIELLTKKLLAKDNMQKLVDQVVMQYKNLQNEATEDVLSLKSRIKEIKVQMDNIVDLICRGMGTDALAYKLKDLEQKKYNLEDELNFKNSNFKIDIKSEDVIKILKRDVDELQDSSKNELKKLIRKWVKKIEVTNDFLDVYFYSEDFLPHQMVARNGFEPSTCRV